MQTPDPRSLTDALTQTLEAAKRVQEIQNELAQADPIEAQAAGGLVTVSAKLPGTVELHIDPKALRLGSEALSEEVARAVNEALTTLRESVGAAAAVDLESVTEGLGELQQQSARQMSEFLDGLMAAHTRAAEREGR